jgi:uncharacterized protein YjdB
MKKIWKRICGAAFVLAMALMLMPVANVKAATVQDSGASEKLGALKITVNDTEQTVNLDKLNACTIETQVYSVIKQGQTEATYAVARGVTLEDLLSAAGIIDESMEELEGCSFSFISPDLTREISYKWLMSANKVMSREIIQTGEDYSQKSEELGSNSPMIALYYQDGYKTYDEAVEAANDCKDENLVIIDNACQFVIGMTGEAFTISTVGQVDKSSNDANLKYQVKKMSQINVTSPAATGISLEEDSVQVKGVAGKATKQLSASVEPAGASLATTINWTSSDESIATVDNTGKITSVDYGTCKITATIADTELSASCDVSVVPPDLEIYLDDQKKATIDGAWMLKNMESEPQIYSVSNGKLSGQVKYLIAQGVSFEAVLQKAGIVQESMTEELKGASVEVISGTDAVGTTIPYAQLVADKVMKGDAPTGGVDVRKELTQYTVSPIVAVYYNKTTTYETYEEAKEAKEATKTNAWKDASTTYCPTTGMSGAPYVFTDGKLDTASADLNWKYHITGTVKIVVHSAKPTDITLDKTELTFNDSKAQKVTATVAPATAAASKVTWTSSDEKVATVSSDGTITPVAKGTCTITASVSDTVKATVSVTVNIAEKETAATTEPTQTAVGKVSITKAVSASYNKTKITWKKVSNAAGYTVYRATAKNGKYTAVKTVSGKTLSYTDKKVTTGKTYYYKVAAYVTKSGNKSYGVKSAVKSVKVVPAAVSNLSVKNTAGRNVKVKWGKVAGADGYVVYRTKKTDGKFKAVATVKNGVTYTSVKLSKGKTYSYKVRAYKLVGNKKVYGPYSDVQNVTIKK